MRYGHINYRRSAKQAKEHKPKMIIGGFSAYSRRGCSAKWGNGDSIRATCWLIWRTLRAWLLLASTPNPVPRAHVATSTTHENPGGSARRPDGAKGGSEELSEKTKLCGFPGGQGSR
ncbi:hypothetical protein ACNKHM_20400 [Shigella sonnei]